jgi:signal transduction histidine kinase
VIAGGRLLLASLFLAAVWADASQPARWHGAVYALLAVYAAWSLAVTLLVWRDWWRDARLAAPAHVIDVAVFMTMLYATQGYTSPYFIFFIFILLAAAIRWGWRETAVTAGAIIAIYFAAGLTLGPSPDVEVQQFIVRTGHLLIISAILIWFGANQWAAWPRLGLAEDPQGPVGGDPFIASLRAGMAAVGARRGTLLWREAIGREIDLVRVAGEDASRSVAGGGASMPQLPGNFLFRLDRDRVLMRADASRWRFLRAAEAVPDEFREHFDGGEGLAIPIATGAAEGYVVFQEVRALSTDHLDFAPRVARDMAVRLQEAELFAAVEERSMAKARVAVARDLHDSVVQFLAGLGFRLEALKRSPAAVGELGDHLAELKDTVMTEQRQLRAFIKGLRTGKPISLNDLTRDCASLCALLSRQWNIDCACACKAETGWVPLRTQLDVHHLVREAVANAVRHGGAQHVRVSLHREDQHLSLTVSDDGQGFAGAAAGGDLTPPASLHGRVREAGGTLKVRSKAGDTAVVIRLPVEDAA